MVIKPYSVPEDVHADKSMFLRVPDKHPEKYDITNRFLASQAGQEGEREIMYLFQFLPEKKFFIFHHLHLYNQTSTFQIDILILTYYFLLILEVKNYSNEVELNNANQLIHKKSDGKTVIYQNPVSQAERQALQLAKWLHLEGFPSIPIESYAVISSSTTLITGDQNNPYLQRIISSSNILPTIKEISRKYKKPYLSQTLLEKLCKQLLSAYLPFKRKNFIIKI